jgi:RNA polymerase sigma-70 factor (ECF subfamily)
MQYELIQLGAGAHALAIQILGNVDDAADAVHDAFTAVLARPDAYDARKGALRPWFMRIVRNRCIDVLRRRRVHDEPDEVRDPGPGRDELLREAQRSERIRRALEQIAMDKREIIVLRDYLDLSYAEIADVLQVAPGTVMSRLHRARLALREALESDGS